MNTANHHQLARYADQAYAVIRVINHATVSREPLPAPDVYDVLGSLKQVGHALDQTCNQLAAALGASLTAYDVYEADGADPAVSVADAQAALSLAADHAHIVGTALEVAQCAIAGQGYRIPENSA